jgi:hypothetical protein
MSEEKRTISATEYVTKLWMHFGPYAYEKFLKHGRGAVRIDLSMFNFSANEGEEWGDMNVISRYLPIDGNAVLDIANDTLDKALEKYDPEREVCFLFVKPVDEAIEQHQVRIFAPPDQPGPKALFESRQRKVQ